jgi:hypothetical protein
MGIEDAFVRADDSMRPATRLLFYHEFDGLVLSALLQVVGVADTR